MSVSLLLTAGRTFVRLLVPAGRTFVRLCRRIFVRPRGTVEEAWGEAAQTPGGAAPTNPP
jgi:hypothetical protein